jgi:hypothetical protein
VASEIVLNGGRCFVNNVADAVNVDEHLVLQCVRKLCANNKIKKKNNKNKNKSTSLSLSSSSSSPSSLSSSSSSSSSPSLASVRYRFVDNEVVTDAYLDGVVADVNDAVVAAGFRR